MALELLIFRSMNMFSLDTISGEIRLAKQLDHETLNRHIFFLEFRYKYLLIGYKIGTF